MITEECNIILSGAQRKSRQFSNLSEFVVFSVIQTMTQAKRGVYDGNLEYLAEWSMMSTSQVRRYLHSLVEKGYIHEERRDGKSTIYQAIPLAKCNPLQNATPCMDATPTPCMDATPHLKYIDINNTTTSSNACAQGLDKLMHWVHTSDLEYWITKQRERFNSKEDTDVLVKNFYDNDLLVREDVNADQRREVLKHFQLWLPKYLSNGNNNTTRNQSAANQRKAVVQNDRDMLPNW